MSDKKILIIDDEPLIREGIIDILSVLNAKFLEASNGKEALNVLQLNSVDLVITDLNMPQMNGVEFLRRKSQMLNKTPTIVLTSHGDKTIEEIVKGLGVSFLLDKPINEPELIKIVKSFIA